MNRKVTIISKLECSEVLNVVLGATGVLQTEASKTWIKARWGGWEQGFTIWYAALASNRRQDLCAEAQQASGLEEVPRPTGTGGLLRQDRYSALCDEGAICMSSAELITVTGARSC